MTTATPWRNRIVAEADVPARDLIANPRNWRKHPAAQADALAGVLDDVGWVQRVIINRTTGHLVDGHLRVSLALKNNDAVPVAYVELTEAEEALILATFDPITGMAVTDPAMLDAVLRDVQTGDASVQALLDQMAQDAGLVPAVEPDAPDDFSSYDEDIETQYHCPKCDYEWSGKPK